MCVTLVVADGIVDTINVAAGYCSSSGGGVGRIGVGGGRVGRGHYCRQAVSDPHRDQYGHVEPEVCDRATDTVQNLKLLGLYILTLK